MWPSLIKMWSKLQDSYTRHYQKWQIFKNKKKIKSWRHCATIMELELEQDIMVNLTMWPSYIKLWSKLLDLYTGHHKMVIFHEQRVITLDGMVG